MVELKLGDFTIDKVNGFNRRERERERVRM